MHTSLLDPHQVAQILHVSRSYVYQILRRGELPAVRLGTALRVRPEDLQSFITRKQLHHTSQFRSTPAPKATGTMLPPQGNRTDSNKRLR